MARATTTPKVRAAIQASDEPASVLAARFGTTEQTLCKWKHRSTVHDRSHTPHLLQSEAEQKTIRGMVFPLNADPGARSGGGRAAQDAAGVDRRPARRGPGIPEPGSLALRPRPLFAPPWGGQSARSAGDIATAPAQPFKACAPGYLHVDVKYLPQMADESSRRTLFVAIDRATRWVFVRVYKSKTAANARRLPHATWNGSVRSASAPY